MQRLRLRIFLREWAAFPLRLVIGFGFAAHGYAKLARGPEHFADVLTAMGVPAPSISAWASTLVEFVGGLSLMLGAYTSLVSVPLAGVMLVAMFSVHLRYGFSSIRLLAFNSGSGAQFGPIGYELNLIYIAALVSLALSGSTPFSIDRWRARTQ